jgi:hypothetical protein
VTDPDGRRRLTPTGRRLAVVETVGFGLIAAALFGAYADPWRAIGALGLGLIWVCQLIDRRTRPA